jgi:anti-anti-sigma factor
VSETPTFGVTCHAGAGGVRVALRGEIDLAVCDVLVAELRDASKLGDPVVVDLAEVTFIDSMGVRALFEGYQAAAELGHRLRVQNAHDWVARVLSVTGVLDLLSGSDGADPEAGDGQDTPPRG